MYSDDAQLVDHIRSFIRSISRPIRRSFWTDWKTATIQSINCGLALYLLTLVVERTIDSALYSDEESATRADFSVSVIILLFIAYLLEHVKEVKWQRLMYTNPSYTRTWFKRLLLANLIVHIYMKRIFAIWLSTVSADTRQGVKKL